MGKRTVIIWIVMLAVASANGALRELLLIPQFGELWGRAFSTVMLSVMILLLTFATIEWLRPRSSRDAWIIGVAWVGLTLAFEFLAGHFLFGNPWSRLLEDYDVFRGRIWVLVLVATAIAPRVCAQARGLVTLPR